MKNIITIDFDPKNKTLIIATADGGIIDLPIDEGLNLKQSDFYVSTGLEKISLESLEEIKKNILNDLRELSLVLTRGLEKTEKNIQSALTNFKNSYLKQSFIERVLSNSDLNASLLDLREYCYKDSLTDSYNSLYYERYLSKNDIVFSSFKDLDEYNSFLKPLIDKGADTLMVCELNNLKVINHLCGDQVGDEILVDFVAELNSIFTKTLNVRYGSDEFVLIGNEIEILDIKEQLNCNNFIKTINSKLPQDLEHEGVGVFATVSSGISEISIPFKVHHSNEIIDFKKSFQFSYSAAQAMNKQNKTLIKENHGHKELTVDLSKEIIDYEIYCLSKNNNEVDVSQSIDRLLQDDGEINLNALGSNRLKGMGL